MTGRVGQVLSIGSTNADVIIITDKRPESPTNTVTYFMKVESGTVQFSVGSAPNAANKAWASTDTIPPITCAPGELYAKQTGAGDTFIVH